MRSAVNSTLQEGVTPIRLSVIIWNGIDSSNS